MNTTDTENLMNIARTCYLCGKSGEMTRDHIPPTGFFPKPRPSNQITVDCCKSCNKAFSVDDEAMRAFLASSGSPQARTVWVKRVAPNTLTRSPKLLQIMREHVRLIGWDDLNNPIHVIGFPILRANNFLLRVAKGMTKHVYPELSCIETNGEVYQLQHNIDIANIGSLPWKMGEVGQGVFKYSYVMSADKVFIVWLFKFYEAGTFMVTLNGIR